MTDAREVDEPSEPVRVDEAVEAMADLRVAAAETADAVDAAFARAGSSLARSMARAAADGEVSLSELARALISTLNAAFGGARGGGLLDGLIGGVVGVLGGAFGGRSGGEAAAPVPPKSMTEAPSLGQRVATPGIGALVGGVLSTLPVVTPVSGSPTAPTRSTTGPGLAADHPPLPGRETAVVDWSALGRAMDRPAARAASMASGEAPWRSTAREAATMTPPGAAPIVVNVSVAGGAEALLRSEAQIAQTLARAASLGARRL